MKNLLIVSDWGHDSLSVAEVKSAILGFLTSRKIPDITFVNTTPSTIHASFITQQLVTTIERLGDPRATVIFQNVDPRIALTEKNKTSANERNTILDKVFNPFLHKLVLMKLFNGIWVFGPNAQFNFSLIKNKIEKIYYYPNFEKGGQFRSRDLYSRICAHLLEENEDQLALEEITLDAIPPLTGFYIGHIDNFGNIKTTIKKSALKGKVELNEKLKIKINGVTQTVKFVNGLFSDSPNQLTLYPGSSGDYDDPYLEISIWRTFESKDAQKTGEHIFNYPSPGDKIELILK